MDENELKEHLSQLKDKKDTKERIYFGGHVLRQEEDDDEGMDPESRVIRFRANTRGIDRHRTRVEPAGCDDVNYRKNPVFLWAHDGYGGWFSTPAMQHVLGRCVKLEKTSEAVDCDIEFATAEMNPMADQALRLVRAGMLNAVSVGFIIKKLVVEIEDEVEVPIVREWELLEISLVSIPSNPEALAISRMMFAADFESHPDEYGKKIMPAMTKALGDHPDIRNEWQRLLSTCDGGRGSQPPDPPAQAADSGSGAVAAAIRSGFGDWKTRQAIRRGFSR